LTHLFYEEYKHMRGTDKDEIIKTVLRESPKTSKELLHECLKRGIQKPTYYYHLKKLKKQGVVKEAKYELIEVGEEADREEVEYCLNKVINCKENKNVVYGEMKHLRLISRRRRIASIPRVMDRLEEFLQNPKIFVNSARAR
jgi:Fe2+ or Zn2+ uptake regulation protein